MMSYFVLAGIFKNDDSKGKNLQNSLRRLEEKNQLHLIPFARVEQRNILKKWFFVRANFKPGTQEAKKNTKKLKKTTFKNSDAFYVLGLCNKVLISKFETIKKEFIIRNSNISTETIKLRVDGFYPELALAIKFLDKSEKQFSKTKQTVFTENAILEEKKYQLVFISYKKLKHFDSGQLQRIMMEDLEVLRTVLEPYYPKTTLF